ncbi:MAG: SAM-dependent methyltransferase [Turicibacter sp.]|uniref:Methyltransferase n=1 Tax=Turicibacter faecis TaxID=2963365 RepID=A0ABN6ZAT4_9FIRM|nr:MULTISPECIES: SAM-dependent methyltransferase [unclassified Turicibacter]MCI8701950.1 SAM-dependent methyltransferase [Turicibacter sp.]BEH90899.1 methyltransferase [Turicibacter sp. TC023]MCI9351222.1 SAM-dependent methyltransferase [Turicibacter sp.]MCU7208788.1 hypothetical protein [Turicibacter sp. 1E2]NCE77961.1 SAM-dependent methyltransferase [Turicibacter sp. TS3]
MKQQLFNELVLEEQRPFSKWDYSYLKETQRMVQFPLIWKFPQVIKPYLRDGECLVQMNRLDETDWASFTSLSKRTVALETKEDHLLKTRQPLNNLGIKVVFGDEGALLPFENETFDVMINRNQRFQVDEVSRVLRENGYFITQQIGGLSNGELNVWLNVEPTSYSNWRLQVAVEQLKESGFTIIEVKEDISKTRFYDIGAIVYYLKTMTEQIPDFSVEKYFDRLVTMKKVMDEEGHLDVTRHRFLIVAKKETNENME